MDDFSDEAEAKAAEDRALYASALDETDLTLAAEKAQLDAEDGAELLSADVETISPWMEEARKRERDAGKLAPATPVVTLLMKLDAWLLQQPEWFLILQAPRNVRRQAIGLIAKHLSTYPARGKTFGGFTP